MIEFSVRRFGVVEAVTSGQVFRWRVNSSGDCEGVDGADWYFVRSGATNQLVVRSSASEDRFRSLFRLDVDWHQVHSEISGIEPRLAGLCKEMLDIPLLAPSDPIEVLFSFLCTSNNHLPRITSMVAYLGSLGVEQAAGHRAFPDLDRLAQLDESTLRQQGFGYRAKSIPVVAQRVLELGGLGYLRQLANADWKTMRGELLELPGVGPKLADCIAIYALGRTDAVPVDTHVWQAYARHFRPDWLGESLTASRYHAVGDHLRSRFGAHAARVQQLLFWDNLRSKRR